MSPRAAWRLDDLGFDAYDYAAGKSDWLAWGLPYEGSARLAGDHLTREVPTCAPTEAVGAVRERVGRSPSGMIVVVNPVGIVLGRLTGEQVDDAADDETVGATMREGPTTVRPNEELEPLLERMDRADVDALIVTRSDGYLMGLFERARGHEALR